MAEGNINYSGLRFLKLGVGATLSLTINGGDTPGFAIIGFKRNDTCGFVFIEYWSSIPVIIGDGTDIEITKTQSQPTFTIKNNYIASMPMVLFNC